MEGPLTLILRIVEFILAFGLLVFLHEFGHYIASKAFGIQVEEFGFGFPPRLVKLFQFRETEFTLNWLPFGAFVRPKGENDPAVPGGLAAAPPWPRLLVLAAGSLMNLATGILLYTLMFGLYGEPAPSRVKLTAIVDGSPAQQAGLRVDDYVVKVNDQPFDYTSDLRAVIYQNLGKEIKLTVERGGQVQTIAATPLKDPTPEKGALGVGMSPVYQPIQPGQWLPRALSTTYNQMYLMVTLPVQLIRGQLSPDQGRVVGPVGIFTVFDTARQADEQMASESDQPAGINTLSLLAMLSIALGITNLLPIPALDGGRILFVLPELLLRRRVPAKYENLVHLVGFAALIILMIYVTTQDIFNPIITGR